MDISRRRLLMSFCCAVRATYYNLFDPGDLLCFWCGCDINPQRQGYFVWGGRA
jgi:hypothetical protein